MQIYLAGDVFFGSINMTRSTKDVDHVTTKVEIYIDEVDSKNDIQCALTMQGINVLNDAKKCFLI